MSLTPDELARLSPDEKRALLRDLLQQKAKEAAPASPPAPQRTGVDQFAQSVANLEAEAVLDESIRPASTPPIKSPGPAARILLTGATGFLGAFLLDELLQRTDAAIHCLVRARSATDGRQRIERNLAAYGLPHDDLGARIVPVVGDLTRPLLALPAAEFDALAQRIDAIYHSAAQVNWITSYTQLKPANVLGTQDVIRLSSRANIPLHFVSSLSVFPLTGSGDSNVFDEQASLDHGGVLYGGYTQSKWVAEKIALIARDRGLPVAIYRPGLITGHSQSGAWNTDDFLSRMIKSWAELGSVPDLPGAIDMTPVDYVSRGIVQLSLGQDAVGKVFHLVNRERVPLRDVWAWMRGVGYALQALPYDQWRAQFMAQAGRAQGDAVYSLLPLFLAGTTVGAAHSNAVTTSSTLDRLGGAIAAQYGQGVTFDDGQTHAALAHANIACPPVDAELFGRYLVSFAQNGFLNAVVTN
jgi:thioester reductase-like protein